MMVLIFESQPLFDIRVCVTYVQCTYECICVYTYMCMYTSITHTHMYKMSEPESGELAYLSCKRT